MTNGTAQIAKKKCNCACHTGPHWIYANEKLKLENSRLRGSDRIIAEIKRLKKLECVMQDNGVLEIFRGQ